MSTELRDFRGKLTVEADAVLDTMSRVSLVGGLVALLSVAGRGSR